MINVIINLISYVDDSARVFNNIDNLIKVTR